MNISTVLGLIGCTGTFGGIIHGIVKEDRYSLQIPFCSRRLELGFLGGIFVGAASAISIFFVASPLFNIRLDNLSETNEFLKTISIALIAGFAGQPIMAGLSAKLVDQISKMDQKVEKLQIRDDSDVLVKNGDFHLHNHNYPQAVAYYNRALEIYPQNIEALLSKGRALKRMGNTAEAIESCSKVLLIDPINDRAFYNRACYKCLAGASLVEILADLQDVFRRYLHYKQYATTDPDFTNIRYEPEFKILVGISNHADKQ